ncbi:MAG: HAD family phosphatase [Alistipes sp.]
MKNIVFDLGGVVFARDMRKCSQEFIDFFAFVRATQMPKFWEEYDRGALSLDEAKEVLCEINHCSRETCDEFVHLGIHMQEPIRATEQLIGELKQAGYKLYVLSNMSQEFIAFLRQIPVYSHFDGEVISCEEHTVKPEPRIYEILLKRYALDPAETLFIDDRAANLIAAERFGLHTQLFLHADPETSCQELRQRLL